MIVNARSLSSEVARRYIPALCFSMLLSISALFAQGTARCELAPIVDGSGTVRCFDPLSLQGKTLSFPSKVTRLGMDALALCGQFNVTALDADIVYVLDQTGSMECHGVELLPNGDTSYTYKPSECAAGAGRTITIPRGDTTQVVPIYRGCPASRQSGDPFGQRINAVANAASFQARLSPVSTAGIIEFSDTIIAARALRSLSAPGADLALTAGITLKGYDGTNYRVPLERAKQWLTNPAIATHRRKVIVFISDGTPDRTDYLNVLSTTYAAAPGVMPPVYGVFMGSATSPYQPLADLSARTGGTFHLIPGNRPDSLSGVIRTILQTVLGRTFTSVTITSATLSQTSRATRLDALPGGGVGLHLDDVIGLGLGNNDMRMTLRSDQGATDTVKFGIFIGDAGKAGSLNGLDYFSSRCVSASSLSIFDMRGGTAPVSSDSSFSMHLSTSASSLTEGFRVSGSAVRSNDRELIPLGNTQVRGDMVSAFGSMPMTVGAMRADDSLLQIAFGDTIRLKWVHARDPRDSAVASIRVSARTALPIDPIPPKPRAPITIGAGPIPFYPGSAHAGTEAELSVRVTSADGISKGWLVIYDATGNVVHHGILPIIPAGRDPYVWHWDGRNLAGRIVGAGTYLLMVEAYTSRGEVAHKEIRIAVAR